jgi:hypothetical protein
VIAVILAAEICLDLKIRDADHIVPLRLRPAARLANKQHQAHNPR